MIRFLGFLQNFGKKLPNIPKIMRSTGWTCTAHRASKMGILIAGSGRLKDIQKTLNHAILLLEYYKENLLI